MVLNICIISYKTLRNIIKHYYICRLSKVAGAQLTYKNSNIADLSDTKRPTKLAEVYSEIYDNEWTDAFENLNVENDKDKIQVLLEVLKVKLGLFVR